MTLVPAKPTNGRPTLACVRISNTVRLFQNRCGVFAMLLSGNGDIL